MNKLVIAPITAMICMMTCWVSSAWSAENYHFQCRKGGAERIIKVVYSQGSKTPCEVSYKKEGAPPGVLWTFTNITGRCESNAQAFVDKQRSWGWQCEQVKDSMEPVPSATNTTDQDVLNATANGGKEHHN